MSPVKEMSPNHVLSARSMKVIQKRPSGRFAKNWKATLERSKGGIQSCATRKTLWGEAKVAASIGGHATTMQLLSS